MALNNLEKLLQGLQAWDGRQEFVQIVDDNREEIIRLEQQQMLSGKKADDSHIGQYKSGKYALMKWQQNPLAGMGNVDLHLTGAFFNDMFVDVRTLSFVMDSGDSKAGDLIDKYGDPFGLSLESRVKIATETIMPLYRERFKEVTGLTMRKV